MRYRLHAMLMALTLSCSMMPSMVQAGFVEGVAAHDKADYATALREFRPLATQGNADAQFNLGQMYSNGHGVPQDYKEATKWYRLAANQGNASAQYNLGVNYDQGQGVPQDYKEAAKLFRLSADQGDAGAQFNLGQLYRKGQGVPQDYKEAAKWYRLAANQGNASAQLNLGVMYDQGQGVASNRIAAYALFNLSASINPSNNSAQNRAILAKLMSNKEVDAAQDLTREIAKPGNLLKALDNFAKNPGL